MSGTSKEKAPSRVGGVVDAIKDGRHRNSERTKANILRVAKEEFALRGYAGARVDSIAANSDTAKRMIYYHFHSKEELYIRVMEETLASIRELEKTIDVEGLSPSDALRALAEQTYDHHSANPDFVRLIANENSHHADFIAQSKVIREQNHTAVSILEKILDRGVAAGEFRDDLDALDVHFLISSFCFDQVASRYSFRVLFGRDTLDPVYQKHYRKLAGDMVVATVSAPSAGS